MNAKKLAEIIAILLKLPLLDFIPKGYLTKTAGYLQVVVGIGLLAQSIVVWMQTGEAPSATSLQTIFGVLLFGNGAGYIGTRRAMGGHNR